MIHDLENRINALMNTGLKGEQQTKFLTTILVLLIDVLRVTTSDEFCIGFFAGRIKAGRERRRRTRKAN